MYIYLFKLLWQTNKLQITNPDHCFTWKILDTCKYWKIRRTKEALLIGRHQPSLNKEVSAFHLSLYLKGIT